MYKMFIIIPKLGRDSNVTATPLHMNLEHKNKEIKIETSAKQFLYN